MALVDNTFSESKCQDRLKSLCQISAKTHDVQVLAINILQRSLTKPPTDAAKTAMIH
jgi:hypothetical protein